MRRTVVVAGAVAGVLCAAPAAYADGHEPAGPPPIRACGSEIEVTELRNDVRFEERAFGFQLTGNAVLRFSDADSSVDLRIPGRLRLTDDPATGVRTIVLTGRNLLVPESPGQDAAIRRAGLPELPVIPGRVVLRERFDPQTGATRPGTEEVVSYTGNVTSLCTLLAR